jgi:membrane associated rhomboid family serine protease
MDTRRYGFSPAFRRGGWITLCVKQIFFICAGVYVLQILASQVVPQGGYALFRLFGMVPEDFLFRFRVWQPLTYIFLHGGLFHLLFNMLVLWMFGCDLERQWGTQRFRRFFVMIGAGSGICVAAVSLTASYLGIGRSDVPTIGASGAIYGILMASAILFPDRQIWLIPFPVMLPMRAYVFVIGLIAFVGAAGSPGDGVSHIAHLSGLLLAWLYLRRGSYFFGLRNRLLDWQRKRARRKFEVYLRDHGDEPPPSRPDRWVN